MTQCPPAHCMVSAACWEAETDALSPRLTPQSAIDLSCHMLGHLRPKHPRLDDSASLLVLRDSPTGRAVRPGTAGGQQRSGGQQGESPGRLPQGAGASGGMTCPFTSLPPNGGQPGEGGRGGGAAHPRPCSFQPASVEDLEAHVMEAHWDQVEALGEALAEVARFHPQSGFHVCPIRMTKPSPQMQQQMGDMPGHGAPPLIREDAHARGGDLCCSSREMARHLQVGPGLPTHTHAINSASCEYACSPPPFILTHSSAITQWMQVHHLSSQAIMAAFANGMASPDSTGSSSSSSSPQKLHAGPITPAAVQCLLCVGSSLRGAPASSPAGGAAALTGGGSLRIAGPAHMLRHLGKVHPRQLLQVLHTLQLLTGETGLPSRPSSPGRECYLPKPDPLIISAMRARRGSRLGHRSVAASCHANTPAYMHINCHLPGLLLAYTNPLPRAGPLSESAALRCPLGCDYHQQHHHQGGSRPYPDEDASLISGKQALMMHMAQVRG